MGSFHGAWNTASDGNYSACDASGVLNVLDVLDALGGLHDQSAPPRKHCDLHSRIDGSTLPASTGRCARLTA